jgi:hypothetical protein
MTREKLAVNLRSGLRRSESSLRTRKQSCPLPPSAALRRLRRPTPSRAGAGSAPPRPPSTPPRPARPCSPRPTGFSPARLPPTDSGEQEGRVAEDCHGKHPGDAALHAGLAFIACRVEGRCVDWASGRAGERAKFARSWADHAMLPCAD